MKAFITLTIILVLVISLAGFGYTQSHKTIDANPVKIVKNAIPQSTTEEGTGTIEDILNFSTAKKCTIKSESISGEIFVGADSMRVDISGSGANQFSLHLIKFDNDFYIFDDTSTLGTRINSNDMYAYYAELPFDASTPLNYSCKSWKVDTTQFSLPKNNFIEAKADNGKIERDKDTTGGLNCASCEELPPAARIQCQASLRCE